MSVRELEQEIEHLKYIIETREKENIRDKEYISNRVKNIIAIEKQIKEKQRFLDIIKDPEVFEKVMARIKDE